MHGREGASTLILAELDKELSPHTVRELSDLTGLTRQSVRTLLWRMKQRGQVALSSGGYSIVKFDFVKGNVGRKRGIVRVASSIYVLGASEFDYVKIGYSADPRKRLCSAQRWSPLKLRILATYTGGPDIESRLHRELTEYRIRGEWFNLGPHAEALEAIEYLLDTFAAE